MRARTTCPPMRSMTGIISMPPSADAPMLKAITRGSMRMNVVGWDIGGVHLKAARAEDGRIVDAMQVAAPLRAGLEPLQNAFGAAKARMGPAELHVITM